MKNQKIILGLVSTAYIALCANVVVADAADNNRAVSDLNGTVEASAGTKNGDGNYNIGGNIDIPLGDKFGLQFDTMYNKAGSEDGGGLAAHYFYRNPESFLLGATAMWYDIEGYDIFRYGAESEFYLDDFTLAPSAGFQTGAANDGVTGFYSLDASYYPEENIKLTIGTQGYSNIIAGYAEAEWQPFNDTPMSFYINGGDVEDGNAFALVGVRFSFGVDGQSLKYRNRHSDPVNIVRNLSIANGGTLHKKAEEQNSNSTGGGYGYGYECPGSADFGHAAAAC